MEKVVAVYKMFLYNRGKVELKPVTLNNGMVDTQGASSSIRQIVKVLEHVATSNSDSGIRRKVSEAINAVAEDEGITMSSVHAKVGRKLGLSMEEFKDQVETYFTDNSGELESTLRNACVARTKAADDAAIEQLLEMIKSK